MTFELPNQETQEEKDKKIFENLQLKLSNINNFQLSGNITEDTNRLLELSGRDNLYEKIRANEDPHEVLASLTGIRDAWQQILKDPNDVDINNEAKKLFYIDVPQAEIEAINKLINFYLEKFSAQEKITPERDLNQNNDDDDFEEEVQESKNF